MLCHDLPRLLSISCHVWLLVKYHHLVMLSFKTKHDTLDLEIIMFTGILSCFMELSATPYTVGATSRIHSLRTKCHMEQSATPHGGGHLLNLLGYYCYVYPSRNLIILISYNLYGYGRKWWMPEWYLAYSNGIKYWRFVVVGLRAHRRYVIRGTLGLQYWFQVYGNYYKKCYQFSIYFR